MKILFLDIDGVINSIRSAVAFGGYPWDVKPESIKLFDPVAITLIRKLCDKTGCKIVLASVWRHSVGHEALKLAIDLPMIDSTPIVHMGSSRGEEIAKWLEKNIVKKYAIVDDDTNMLENQLPYFVKVDSKNGLSYENYLALLNLLT